MVWSLYSKDKFLEPLRFSNGKTQEDVVNEVLASIKEGNKVIFIHGICGTGKSAIALHLAKELGRASIVVPIKSLQEQYKQDYEGDKYVLKKNPALENIDESIHPKLAGLKNKKEKLKISVITGRANHKCKFLSDSKSAIPVVKKEQNMNLHDIFAGKREEVQNAIGRDLSAENMNIPCKIELKEKNWNRIKKYLLQNKKVKLADFSSVKDVRRMSIAGVCPYWSPVLPDRYELKFDNAIKKSYTSLGGEKCVFYQRKPGCPFYEQFNSYIDSDVIVFNSLKYKYESSLGRKPLTAVEIIDECDEFLDSFANQRNLNIERLQNALIQIAGVSEEAYVVVKEALEIIKHVKNNERINMAATNGEIIPLRETGLYDLFKLYMKNSWFVDEIDEESYVFDVHEIVRAFDEFLNETYMTITKKENNLIASLVTTNLEKRFKEMVKKNKAIVLMSGTLHSEDVLKEIFGLNDFKIIEAEIESQGRIEVQRTGLEMDCKYSNFSQGKHSREDYLVALDKCVGIAKRPTLVHVNAFIDLPTDWEITEFNLKHLPSREELQESQKEDRTGQDIREFKEGKREILFSTKASRGIDFPGEQCNSIVFTKYPNPNVQDAFWKILMKTKPQYYWNFYRDKARRELWQKIYRGLRFEKDYVYVLSPDSRVLEVFEEKT